MQNLTKLFRSALLGVALLAFTPGFSWGAAFTLDDLILDGGAPIDFEGLNDLDPVTTQFAPAVVFSNATALISGAVGGSLNEFEFPPRSGVTVVDNNGAGPMLLTFGTPLSTVSGFVTYEMPLVITAFNPQGMALGSVHTAFSSNLGLSGDPGSSPNEQFTLSGLGPIGSVELNPVPEPATMLLVASGLGGLFLRKRRSAR